MAEFGDNRLADKIWPKVEAAPSGCWLWRGTLSTGGYGRIQWNGRTRQAHRFVYEALVGEIPAGLVIDHLCCVHNCVNPAHLRACTHAENILAAHSRSVAAINKDKTHCPRGHPYDEQNTFTRPSKPGCRECRRCHNDYKNSWRKEGRRLSFTEGFNGQPLTRTDKINLGAWKRGRESAILLGRLEPEPQ